MDFSSLNPVFKTIQKTGVIGFPLFVTVVRGVSKTKKRTFSCIQVQPVSKAFEYY